MNVETFKYDNRIVRAFAIATVLFFQATGMVREKPTALGAVEAMQGAEILFSTTIGVLFLGESWPDGWSIVGAVLVMGGITGFGLLAGRRSIPESPEQRQGAPVLGAVEPGGT